MKRILRVSEKFPIPKNSRYFVRVINPATILFYEFLTVDASPVNI